VEKRDETAEWTAAEIEHACRRRRQTGANERPERGEPAFAGLHRQILGLHGAGLAVIEATGLAILVAHRLIFNDSSDGH
jgi:hypothetical protein